MADEEAVPFSPIENKVMDALEKVIDPELGIDWGVDRADAVLSDKDAAAPALAEVHARLADWQEARGWEQQLRREWSEALDFADSYGEHGEG